MARAIHKLTDRAVKGASKAGRVSDGGGLYLRVSANGSKSWSFMSNRNGDRDEIGLGAYPAKSLASARATATLLRAEIAENRNPRLILQQTEETAPTFAECVDRFLVSMEPSWRNEKHRAQWRMTLGDGYCKHLQKMPVSEIGNSDVLKVLSPVWQTRHETATRLRGRIERVLNFAKVKGWRTGENPALWRGNLDNLLPKRQKLTRGHHAAMSYADIPAFIEKLRTHEALAARALELLILTAARSGETLHAQWPEIDMQARVWTIPKQRTKTSKEHRVPLTDAILEILQPLYATRTSDYVFPGQAPKKPLSNMSMHMLLRRMKIVEVTVHGFRSSFRDWAGDQTTFPREIAEACLAHSVGNEVEQAYRRGDALEKRRLLLGAWSKYCVGDGHSKVVNLHGRSTHTG